MTTAQLAPTPVFTVIGQNGTPLSQGYVYTYAAGTTTPQASYPSQSESTPNPNPIQLNSMGQCALWLDPTLAYKINVTDSLGNAVPGWPVDNIAGPFSASTSIIPSVTNVYTLGSATYSWAQVYVGPNGAPIYNSSSNIVGYYGQTSAETAISAVPTNYSYPADPYVDPRRYGADPTGGTVSTTAVQTAINVAAQGNGMVWIGENCNFLIGAVTYTATGTHASSGLRIVGSSVNGSKLTASGTPAALLTFVGSTPTGAPQEFPFVMENLTITGTSGTGLLLEGVAYFRLSNLFIFGFTTNLYLYSALIGLINNGCQFRGGTYGILARADGAGSATNLVKIRDCGIYSNSWAVDWGTGQALTLESCDLEGNGTSTALTLSGAPLAGATSATLNASWSGASGTWPVIFYNSTPQALEGRAVTFTNGSTAISWDSTMGLVNSTLTANAMYTTAAVAIRATTSSSTGYSQIKLDGMYFEANTGPDIYAEADSAKTLSIRNTTAYSATVGQSIITGSIGYFSLEDSIAPSSGAPYGIYTLNYTYGFLKNVFSYTLYDFGTYPVYHNVNTSSAFQVSGRTASALVTLIGCTTQPTGYITAYQQGKNVVLRLPTVTATSNATTAAFGMTSTATGGSTSTLVDSIQSWSTNQWAGQWVNNTTNGTSALVASNTGTTLTLSSVMPTANASGNTYVLGGLPFSVAPLSAQNVVIAVENNSAGNLLGTMSVTTGGLMSLFYASAWTNSGTKGVNACSVTYNM